MAQPNIIMTKLDAERLEALIDRLPNNTAPGIEKLQDELLRATVVESKDIPADVVTMNSKVTFRIDQNGKEFSLKLVYPKDADGSADKISILAPMGSALIGMREGATIAWPVAGGEAHEVIIVRVDEQPEREGNFAL